MQALRLLRWQTPHPPLISHNCPPLLNPFAKTNPRCVVVEDSRIGMLAAKAAGMTCVITKSSYTQVGGGLHGCCAGLLGR
jgi:beta-phosphoglucomutase-like phosphatase (HAD superfamily)